MLCLQVVSGASSLPKNQLRLVNLGPTKMRQSHYSEFSRNVIENVLKFRTFPINEEKSLWPPEGDLCHLKQNWKREDQKQDRHQPVNIDGDDTLDRCTLRTGHRTEDWLLIGWFGTANNIWISRMWGISTKRPRFHSSNLSQDTFT